MRSPIKVTVSGGAGISPWIPLDYLQRPFNVSLFAILSNTSDANYTVEYTPDNPNSAKGNTVASLTRSTTVATLTMSSPHEAKVGDSVITVNTGDPNLDGVHQVASIVSATVLTYTVANTGLTAQAGYAQAIICRVFPHAFMAAQTSRQSGNFAFPCWAVRLNVNTATTGDVTLEVIQGYARG